MNQNMIFTQFVTHIRTGLASSAAFTSLPLSCLLIGLDALINLEFSCPCRVEYTKQSSIFLLILFAPACFAFLLMFLLLRPFKFECCSFFDKCDVGSKLNCSQLKCRQRLNNSFCLKQFVQCLVPPVVWFFLVLHDGNYLACYKTDWNGKYVFDDELKKKWCKPTDSSADYNQRQRDTQGFLFTSQIISYSVLIVFCGIAIILVGLHDCLEKNHSQEENNSTGEDPIPLDNSTC